MRTIDLESPSAEIVAFLVHQQLAPGVLELVQGSVAEVAAAIALNIDFSTFQGTSASSVAIADGSKVFTTQAGKVFGPGTFVQISSDADPTANWMHGVVSAYAGTTLTVTVEDHHGSGTHTDWTIRVSGPAGDVTSELEDLLAAAEAAAVAAEAAAAQIGIRTPLYASYQDALDAGVASLPSGRKFSVLQGTGLGTYDYSVDSGVINFRGVSLYEVNSQDAFWRYAAASPLIVPPKIADLDLSLWGNLAVEWDGRVVPNEMSAVLPTLNLIPDPFNPLDEIGSTPTRERNTAATTDPLGGNNALKLSSSAQNDQLTVYATGIAIPTDTYRLRTQVKAISGGTALKLGSTSGLSVTAGGAWAQEETILAAFSGAAALGISTAVGNTTGVWAVAAFQIIEPLAATPPTAAHELSAQAAGHAKMPLAFKGSISLSPKRAIQINGAVGGLLVHLTPDTYAPTAYAMGVWFKCDTMPTGTSGSIWSFDFHTGGATNLHGQLGLYGAGDAVAGRPGRLYLNPLLGTASTANVQNFVGQGWHHFTVVVDGGVTIGYINAVPVVFGTDGAWTALAFHRLILGAYSSTTTRRKTGTPYVGDANGAYLIRRAPTPAEIIKQDVHGRARLRSAGETVTRKFIAIGGGDSLTANVESWFWHLGENKGDISPSLHGPVEAVGGSGITEWLASPRYGQMLARIDAAAQIYEEVWIFMLFDIEPRWVTDGGGYDYTPWFADYLAYIAGLKARSPKVKVMASTLIPRPGIGTELLIERERMEHNDNVRTNWASLGFNGLLDFGLGTERVNVAGTVFTAESIPGGTIMGNWRTSQGGKTHARSPAAALTLSALSGASFTATAAAGTFSSADVYRKLEGGTGSAQIVAVNGDGSVATLSTSGYTPPPWSGEGAATIARDTITRTAFDLLSYASGDWSVKNDTHYYQGDGIHPQHPGGRIMATNILGIVQSINARLTGQL